MFHGIGMASFFLLQCLGKATLGSTLEEVDSYEFVL
jgi:hypothetical protein